MQFSVIRFDLSDKTQTTKGLVKRYKQFLKFSVNYLTFGFMKLFASLLVVLFLVSCGSETKKESPIATLPNSEYQTVSLLGDTLRSAAPSSELLETYQQRKAAYEQHPDNLEALIWYGRFTAYTGEYRKAVAIYSEGLERFEEKTRLLRHRGHRYITLREFDKAIADLSEAAELIQGKANKIEEDGMPNEQNIPVSTLHGNIYYHLGLAYYLDRQMLKALDAFKKGLSIASNADNVVACTHWIYMIQNRLGRQEAAKNYLRNITANMPVIENKAYHKACLFYKGEIPYQDLYDPDAPGSPDNSALAYAVGNWILYNGNPQKGQEVFKKIVSGADWASFGYIAAEVDLAKPYASR